MRQINKLIRLEERSTPQEVDIHDLIEVLITTLNVRDKYTYEHSWRVAEVATEIAQEMGLNEERVEIVHQAAHLHDIGKVGVDDKVLNKSGKLTELEYKEMQKHPVIGYNILAKIDIFEVIAPLVLYHHERYDGLGYPEGIVGEDIPLASRIIGVADAFDAMTSNRSYRQAKSYDYAYQEINEHVGEQFCPTVVENFNHVFVKLPNILAEVNNELKTETNNNYDLTEVTHNEIFHSKKI